MINKIALSALTILGLLTGCGPKADDQNTVLIGTIAGPETELVEVVKEVAKNKYNLDVHIVPFNDYVEPNRALAEGEINANMFQHQPYLDQVIANQKLPLISIGALFIYPVGIYSDKYKNIADLKQNAVVVIPNDVSNQERSLLLLEKAGLIKLKTGHPHPHNKFDIESNPKNIKFEEVDPAFMVRMLPDVDLAVINTNYAALAGLLPSRDALFVEDKESKYANILVVREQDKDQQRFRFLLEAFHSDEVVKKANKLFQNQAIVAW